MYEVSYDSVLAVIFPFLHLAVQKMFIGTYKVLSSVLGATDIVGNGSGPALKELFVLEDTVIIQGSKPHKGRGLDFLFVHHGVPRALPWV